MIGRDLPAGYNRCMMGSDSFLLESEMTGAVRRWLAARGMMTRLEYPAPWGICDAVGAELDRRAARERLSLGQRGAVGPLERVAILRRMPAGGAPVSRGELCAAFAGRLPAAAVERHVAKLVAGRFVVEGVGGCLSRAGGRRPLVRRIVAVELKLRKVSEVLRQAAENRAFADESFVALPAELAARLRRDGRLGEFRALGVGVLAVSRRGCSVVLAAGRAGHPRSEEVRAHCAEQFWRDEVARQRQLSMCCTATCSGRRAARSVSRSGRRRPST